MAGKMKHALRSRKTHRYNLMGARRFMRGSEPYWMRKLMNDYLSGKITDEDIARRIEELENEKRQKAEEEAAA